MMPDLNIQGAVPVGAWIPTLDDDGYGTATLTDLISTNDGTFTNGLDASAWITEGSLRSINLRSTGFITMGNVLNFGQGSFTASVWVKMASDHTTVSSGGRIVQKRGTGNPGNYPGWQVVAYRTSGTIARLDNSFWDCGSRDYREIANVNFGTVEEWAHLLIVFDKPNLEIRTYVNGTLETTTDASIGPGITAGGNVDNTRSLTIGASDVSQTQYFKGEIDDVRLFDIALTPEQVAAHYANGNGRGIVAPSGPPFNPIRGIQGSHPLRSRFVR